tara:strand:- start:118 stop:492 length:375 start_codon:yes stop_codon:yes gene_type:complete
MTVNVGGQTRGRGAEAVAAEEKKEEQSKINPSDYSCEVILEKTTKEKANDRKLPSDAFEVCYVVDGEERLDVTRSGKAVNVFDMYYDKYGKDSVKKIDYGQGTVNPSQWGYKNKEPQKKKRRKG